MPWVYFGLSAGCFAVAFRTHSLGLASLALVAALVLMLIATLSLASARIQARSQSAAALLGPEQVAAMKRRKAAKSDASASEQGKDDHDQPGANP